MRSTPPSGSRVGKEEDPSTYLSSVEASVKEYNDAAILVISRNGAEAQDVTADLLKLTDAEVALVEYINKNFDNVIVMLNTANAIELGWPIEDSDEFETVAGFVLELADKLPRPGDTFEREGYQFTVQSMRGRRVSLLRVTAPEQEPEEDADQPKDRKSKSVLGKGKASSDTE